MLWIPYVRSRRTMEYGSGYPSLDCPFQHDMCPTLNHSGCCTYLYHLDTVSDFWTQPKTVPLTICQEHSHRGYTIVLQPIIYHPYSSILMERLEPNLIGAADLFERFGTNPVKRKRVPRTDSDSIVLWHSFTNISAYSQHCEQRSELSTHHDYLDT